MTRCSKVKLPSMQKIHSCRVSISYLRGNIFHRSITLQLRLIRVNISNVTMALFLTSILHFQTANRFSVICRRRKFSFIVLKNFAGLSINPFCALSVKRAFKFFNSFAEHQRDMVTAKSYFLSYFVSVRYLLCSGEFYGFGVFFFNFFVRHNS